MIVRMGVALERKGCGLRMGVVLERKGVWSTWVREPWLPRR